MPSSRDKYLVQGIDLFHVRNRNETRVAQCLNDALIAQNLVDIPEERVRDAYARALNALPARYIQRGTIVLREPVRKEHIEEAVKASLKHVLKHPKKRA